MKLRSRLGSMVFASILAVCAGQIAFAQVDWTFEELVVPPGPPGSWDSYRHVVQDVVFDGTTYHLYLTGGQTSNPWHSPWHVGHWTWNALTQEWDPDTEHNPVLSPEPGAWDGYTVYSVAVLYDGGVFKMWYGAASEFPGVCSVGYATSSDGSDWTKQAGPLPGLFPGAPGTWDDFGMNPSTVLIEGGSYRMWYHAVQGDGSYGTYRIGTATSTDGITWTKHPEPVLVPSEPWEADCVDFPEVIPMGGGYAMWYGGVVWGASVQVGYAVSPDGVHWGKWPDNPVLTPLAGCAAVDALIVIALGDTVYGWTSNCNTTYHVTSPLDVVFFDAFETGDTAIWSVVVP